MAPLLACADTAAVTFRRNSKPASLGETIARARKLRKDTNAVLLNFFRTELIVASTLCVLAGHTTGPKRDRRREQARWALEVALRITHNVAALRPDAQDWKLIEQLRSDLALAETA